MTRAVARVQTIPISEAGFQRQVQQLAQMRGWRVHHNWTEMHSAKGWPDLVLCRGSRLIFAELKSETGKVRPEQETWLADLKLTGNEAYLWRPSDFNEIQEVLA